MTAHPVTADSPSCVGSRAERDAGVSRWLRNPRLRSLVCTRCSAEHPVIDLPAGCPRCRAEGHPASVQCRYDGLPGSLMPRPRGYRWGDWLPYLQGVSLGEGDTPLIELPALARSLGLDRLSAKLESCNPTGSHKDRMSALGVTRALDVAAPMLALASSGNAAVSAAAYAAAAGLPCEVAVYRHLAEPFARALRAHGASIVAFDSGPDRWRHVQRLVEREGAFALTNFMVPASGSPALAVEAYKAVAYECAFAGQVPDHVVVPVARGDLLAGIAAGFSELEAVGLIAQPPRLWAVEPFARLTAVLAGASLQANFAGSTDQFSVAGNTVTHQQWHAVRSTGGGAVVVDDAAALRAQQELARSGLWAERCAAATLDATRQLVADGEIRRDQNVMLVITARADREPAPLSNLPTLSPDLSLPDPRSHR